MVRPICGYTTIYQFQGSEQSYWNVGVNVSVPLEDILDLKAAVKRKKLLVDQARIEKDLAYDNLKKDIASLYIKITNNLVTLKTQSEASAIYQGAGALNQEDFHQGNMTIEKFADTKLHEVSLVNSYQGMQTEITTDIITLELLTHTPILTNTTTDITTNTTTGGDVEDKLQVIISFCDQPRSRAEIQERLGIKSDRYVREKLLSVLLEDGRLARTIPDKPKSVKQKYIATRTELERAQAIMDNNPVLQLSPGDLFRKGQTVEEYLKAFGEDERKKYLEYYEDEV